jgi:DNA-binding IclR family transcriptional regulator
MTITTTHPAPAAEPGGPGGPQALRSVPGKAGLILTAFREDDLSLSLTELTRRTGIAKVTVHRLCQGLIEAELLERQAARPIVEELAQALGRNDARRDISRTTQARQSSLMDRLTGWPTRDTAV